MKKVTLTPTQIEYYITYSGQCKFESAQKEYEWADQQTKKCGKCHTDLPLTCFGFNTSSRYPFNKDGIRLRRGECLDCGVKVQKGKTNAVKIAKKQGINVESHKVGECEYCKRVEKLVFDHDHKRAIFRGWLCDPCNRSIGVLENRGGDEWFKNLGEYVNRG